ncbi:MAG: gliding motility-associated C-terminal domain-containing protein [Haliscomenobacteraceae bacterium CHB4]|nr:gliding motility-associated C-terminal domain-containing protein [Haliscomenobacteraceae bacterium CHB4]
MKQLLILLLFFSGAGLFAQVNTMCGNGDFESGAIDPAEWTGQYRDMNPAWNCVDVLPFNTGIVPGPLGAQTAHHTIESDGPDPTTSGALMTVPPFPGSNLYSVRLGNTWTERGDEKLIKRFLVQPGQTTLRFWFASVMENPGSGHDCTAGDGALRPGFGVNIFDQFGNDFSFLVDLGNGEHFLPFDPSSSLFHEYNSQVYYTSWDCREINLDTLVNQMITVEFYNRDCFGLAHFGYTYIDNICGSCSGGASGSLELASAQSDTCGLPGEICINYTLPNSGAVTGDCQLDLTIYQNGVPLVLFSSPVLTFGSQYCFPLNTSNLSALNNGLGGFDFSVTGHFTIPDNMGGTMVLPDKKIGDAPDGVVLGQNNDYDFICQNGPVNCDSLLVSATLVTDDRCCYSIDLLNAQSAPIAYVEATLISTDWMFSAGATLGSGFSWFSPPGATSLPITITSPAGGTAIPPGFFNNALYYCLEPVVSGTTQPQVVVFTWYTPIPGGQGYRPVCKDTIIRDCKPDINDPCVTFDGVVDCHPQNPYEYFVTFTVTNNSGFTATHVSLDNISDPVQFGFSACTASDHLSSIAIPLPSPLPPGNTSPPLCVKITSLNPVLTATTVTFFPGLYSPFDCCHREVPVSLSLKPCCDPCSDISVQESPLVVPGSSEQCCWSLDIVNNCAYKFFTKVETEIITPGIQFGYHSLGGPDASDWNMGGSTPTSLIWVMNGPNYIPSGTTMDIIQFCLDGIDHASESPQLIAIKWFTKDRFGKDSLACTDTLTLPCEPVIDYECLEVTNQLLECFPDDSLYCYSFTVENTSDIPFGATNLDLFEMTGADIEFTGGGGTFPLPPLNPGDTIRLSVCFRADSFPLNDSFLIFRYRLRYLMGDTCCYEGIQDTIRVPDCFPDTICPPKCCCYPANISLPTGLSPNNDGMNDLFVIKGIERCQQTTLTVYNRWGNVVYEKDHYDNSWNGVNKSGEDLPQGTYYFLLKLHDSGVSMSGFVDLRRL